MFRQNAFFSILFFLLAVSPRALAYQLECRAMHMLSIEDYAFPGSSYRIQTKMREYQGLMGLSEISHKAKDLDELKIQVSRLGPEKKKALLGLVQSTYSEVKALKYNGEGPFKSFKRHLDLIVSELTDARGFFKSRMVDELKSLEETLTEYYRTTAKVAGVPVRTEGADVLLAAVRLQSLFLKPGSINRGPIVLYGSLINGKAYLRSSDLDFVVSDAGLERELRTADLVKELSEFPISEAQPHLMTSRSLHSLGYLNPLVLYVYPDYIMVRVYGKSLSNDFKNRKVPFEDYYF